MTFSMINPANGQTLKTYSVMSSEELETLLQQAAKAQIQWSRATFEQRSQVMRRAQHYLLKSRERFAKLIMEEMGKPLHQALIEIEKCASACEYYAQHAEDMLISQEVATEAKRSFVAFRPMGLLLAVMPWNYPFWQV